MKTINVKLYSFVGKAEAERIANELLMNYAGIIKSAKLKKVV